MMRCRLFGISRATAKNTLEALPAELTLVSSGSGKGLIPTEGNLIQTVSLSGMQAILGKLKDRTKALQLTKRSLERKSSG